ncbi:hypothetical protein Tco_0962306 [Tanacetum coccineum]
MVEKNKLDKDLKGTPVDATLYRGMIGSLMYLTSSRPDLIYAVCLCARYQAKPTEKHLNAVKRIFQYLKGTINMGLSYSKDTEVKYIALSGCCAQILWMRSQLADYCFQFNNISLYCDNKSAIALCCNQVQHSRAKHIDVHYHFIKEQRKIQFLDREARYEKHVFVNAKTSDIGRGRVKVVTRAQPVLSIFHRIMSSITTQQAKLDLELVPKEKRLEIRKCNGRINPEKTQREPTFQVVPDALALTPCYSAFLTTTDVPEICPRVHGQDFDELPTDEICPRVYGQDFDELPTDEVIVSLFKELGHTREINPEMRETKAYKTYIGYAIGVTPPKKARKFKKSASPKLKTIPASPKEPTKKSKRVKRPAKKSTNAPTVGVVIRDTPGVSVSKNITPAKADRGKGIELLSDAALLEEAQINKTLKKSKQETHKLQASGSRTGVKPGVPDVSIVDSSESDNESWGDSDDDNESDDNDDEGTKNDDDKEETQEEEYDVNVRSEVAEHEEVRKGDVEMTDAARESRS